MSRIIVFYIALGVFLLGFGLAVPTAGAPAAVVTGTVGLFGLIAATVARLDTPAPLPITRRSR